MVMHRPRGGGGAHRCAVAMPCQRINAVLSSAAAVAHALAIKQMKKVVAHGCTCVVG